MAIEITSKKKIKVFSWSIIFGFFCLILIFALIISYFYLTTSTKKTIKEIQKKEKALMPTPREKSLEENLNLNKTKIKVFSELIAKHRNPGNIFVFLEKTCLPNVQFLNFDFDNKKNMVDISGTTDNFISLEQQVLSLKQDPLVKKIKISEISINQEKGTVDFTFLITFDPKIFQ